MHAVVEEELGPGRLQEGIDLLQRTQGVISAVKRSATRERVRPPRNSTRAARDTRRGTAENTISPANSPGTEEKDEIASNSRVTEMCDENEEGLDSGAAIAFGNLEKKPIDWCEAQSRNSTARLVIKLLRAKAKREDTPADDLKNREIDPDEVWRLLDQCELTALLDHDNRKLLVRRPTRESVPRPNRKPGRYERLLGDEPVRVYDPLMLRSWMMDRIHEEAVYLGGKVILATRAVLPPGRNGVECQVVDQEMLRLPGSQEDERYGTMAFSISGPPFWPRPDGRVRSAGIPSKN